MYDILAYSYVNCSQNVDEVSVCLQVASLCFCDVSVEKLSRNFRKSCVIIVQKKERKFTLKAKKGLANANLYLAGVGGKFYFPSKDGPTAALRRASDAAISTAPRHPRPGHRGGRPSAGT